MVILKASLKNPSTPWHPDHGIIMNNIKAVTVVELSAVTREGHVIYNGFCYHPPSTMDN